MPIVEKIALNGITFDDVLLQPNFSSVLPSDVDVTTHLTRNIPLNIPLGLAITEYLLEFGTPAIAHHHDFYWERSRFSRNACADYLNTAFPPRLPTIQHVVINSSQAEQLSLRAGIASTVALAGPTLTL